MYKVFHKDLTRFAKVLNTDIQPVVEQWVKLYEHRLKHKGKANAIKFMKDLLTVAERYALHQAIEPIPWTKSRKDGYPKCISSLRSYLRSSDSTTVWLTLSVFRSVELLRLPISKDISTVTEPPSGLDEQILEEILNFIPKFVKRLRPLTLKEMKYHMTLKNGPNGPALWSSDLDSQLLSGTPHLRGSIRAVEKYLRDTNGLQERATSYKTSSPPTLSKLAQFPEKSGKTRTIAVVDYYSQRALKPLHDGLMQLLKALKADGTFSHRNVGKFAQAVTTFGSYAYCADLTAFTDRFPGIVQRELLRELLGNDDLAKDYWTLLSEREFSLAWDPEVKVKYGTGQPMGCYASWPLCSLAHHLVVHYAAYKGNVTQPQSSYRLIGDDVIISDQVIASQYRSLITGLGLQINAGKTVESTSDVFRGAEVAKQLYLNGTCLTPITPGFVRDIKKPYMFPTCIAELVSRYEISPELPPMLIAALFPKEQDRKLVWILATEPLDGVIKPGMPGYEDNCPWLDVTSQAFESRYVSTYFSKLQSKTEDLYADLVEYLKFREGPLADLTQNRKPTFAHSQVLKDLRKRLDRLQQLDQYMVDIDDLRDLAYEYAYLPDPRLPFMERKEMRSRRLASLVEQVFNTMVVKT